MAKSITLINGETCLVDDEDFEVFSHMKWHLDSDGYVCGYFDKHTSKIHRMIMNAQKGQMVDHINGDKLDNRKSNLRFCTKSQNSMNRGADRDNKIGYKGVSARRGKYRARIKVDGKEFHLGDFTTPQEAAKAYNVAALHLHKDFSRLNTIEGD